MANLEHTTSSMLPIQSFLIHMAVMCGYGATEGMWAKSIRYAVPFAYKSRYRHKVCRKKLGVPRTPMR